VQQRGIIGGRRSPSKRARAAFWERRDLGKKRKIERGSPAEDPLEINPPIKRSAELVASGKKREGVGNNVRGKNSHKALKCLVSWGIDQKMLQLAGREKTCRGKTREKVERRPVSGKNGQGKTVGWKSRRPVENDGEEGGFHFRPRGMMGPGVAS